MQDAIRVEWTTRENGVGAIIGGWFVTHYSIPVGKPYRTKGEAEAAAGQYRLDLQSCIAGI